MVIKMLSAVVIILVALISSTSGDKREDWIIKIKETLAMTRQLIQLVQKFNKDAWTGDRCDDNPCNDVGCNTGTCYADGFGLPHCVCPVGKSGQFCEIEYRCQNLESPLNIQIHVTTPEYTCKNNYRLCGPNNTISANDTVESRITPVCIQPYAEGTYLTVQFGGSTYYISGDKLSFENAQKYCENLGGNLLSVNSVDEWNFIKCVLAQEIKNPGGFWRWIGLLKSNDTWAWTSGEPLTVSYLSKYHVNSHLKCGIIAYDLWISTGCSNKNKFICENIIR